MEQIRAGIYAGGREISQVIAGTQIKSNKDSDLAVSDGEEVHSDMDVSLSYCTFSAPW